MWQCPKCETLNDDEPCIICAEAKPIIKPSDLEKKENQGNACEQYSEENNYVRDEYEGLERGQKVVVFVLAFMILMIIIASFYSAY